MSNFNFNNFSVLEMAEYIAFMESMITNEQHLSELFDEMIKETAFFQSVNIDDEAAINEHFHNWKDGLHRDGRIHDSQCNEYCYVGKFS